MGEFRVLSILEWSLRLLVDPATLFLLLALVSFIFRKTRFKLFFIWTVFGFSIALSSQSLAYLASEPLERYAINRSGGLNDVRAAGALCTNYAGVITLGGVIPNSEHNASRGIQLGSSAERIVEPVKLFQKCPNLKLVFTSFGKNLGDEVGESELAREVWVSLGVPKESIQIENASTSTRENALRTSEMLGTEDRWLLVTSALHMKRAIGAFEKVGMAVDSVPVDYLFTQPPKPWSFSFLDGMNLWRAISHEYFGYAYYKINDWIS